MLLASLTLLAGCATNGAGNCAGWQPIYVSRGDVLTDPTARDILAHNRNGVAQGCWVAPRKR